MTINISESAMGFTIRLSGKAEDFQTLLANLKDAIPAACRSYSGGRWFVHGRAKADVNHFLSSMRLHYGAEVIHGGVASEVSANDSQLEDHFAPPELTLRPAEIKPLTDDEPLPVSESVKQSLLKLAQMSGYLSIDENQTIVELEYQAVQSKKQQPAIVLSKLGRWYTIKAHCYGPRLTDEARNAIFDALMQASLPGGKVRVSNAIVYASRIPFGAGVTIAQWLASVMFEPSNREKGTGRDFARCEGEKRSDGSVKVLQSGITRQRSDAA